MASSFLITLREGLEASLVVAILLTYLSKTNRQSDSRSVWFGAITAIVICLVVGIVVFVLVDGLHGKVEQSVETVIAVASAAVLTQMIFWMRENAQSLSAELRGKVDGSTQKALFIVAFVAVVREGLETALFLISAKTPTASGSSVVIGGLIGLLISVAIGLAVFAGGRRIDLKKFFSITAVLLLLFAAGLAGKAAHELADLVNWHSGWLVQSTWTIDKGVLSSGTFYDFMNGLFGWHYSPERIRVIIYFAYLIPVMAIYRRGSIRSK
ncbi:MAG: FTR1 family iron permease [Actinobacteria bacterium]|nr:MAG: FTR1 family iron permease [Actinomycetota bacterium]